MTEPNSELAIRVLITINPLEKIAIAAEGNTALRYDLETAFSAEQSTQAWLLSYSRATLIEAFPELSSYTDQQIAETLAPSVNGDDGFLVPEPDSVAQISEISRDNKGLAYTPSTWNQWLQFTQQGSGMKLRFRLAPELGCPWGKANLRLFSTSTPQEICSVSRSATCEWEFLNCSNEVRSSICRGTATQAQVFQSPNGDLNVGEIHCAFQEVASDTQGLTQTWSCSAGTCADSSVTLASQEVPLLSDTSLADREWKASAIVEHQATFPTGTALYDGKRDLIISAYEDESERIRFRTYQWILSQENVDTVEQRQIPVADSGTIASAEYGTLKSIWIHKDRSTLILNGENKSYLLKNQAAELDDAGQMQFSTPQEISHDQSANGVLLSESPEFFLSDQLPGRFYAVSQQGIAVFSDNTSVLSQTPNSAALNFSTGKFHLFVGHQDLQERVIVCPLVPPKNENCGLKLYFFDSDGQFLAEKRLMGPLLATIHGLTGFFSQNDFSLGKVDLSHESSDPDFDLIYVPAIDRPREQAERRLRISQKSFSANTVRNDGTFVLGITYGRFAGILDLDSGLSTAAAASDDEPVDLLAIITNRLQTAHFLLVQDRQKGKEPRWVFVPSLR